MDGKEEILSCWIGGNQLTPVSSPSLVGAHAALVTPTRIPPSVHTSSLHIGRTSVHQASAEAQTWLLRHRSIRHTLGEDVPLHDPHRWVAAGAICPQIHKIPLEPGRSSVQDCPAFLQKLFRINGLQMSWVRWHQVLRVLGGSAAVQCLGKSTIESARTVSHGTRCRKGKQSAVTHSAPFAFFHFTQIN